MRVDLYLKLMGVTKTRMAAKRLCDKGMIRVNQEIVKPSREIVPGDSLEVLLPQKETRMKVLQIPARKSVSKKERLEFMAIESVREL